jgi:hypothetical protein
MDRARGCIESYRAAHESDGSPHEIVSLYRETFPHDEMTLTNVAEYVRDPKQFA